MQHRADSEERGARLLWRIAREAMDVACAASGDATIHEMTLSGRSRAPVAYARQIAMYLAHIVGQMTMGEIAIAFKRDRTTVSHACHTIEDRRENVDFDETIAKVEAVYRRRLSWLLDDFAVEDAAEIRRRARRARNRRRLT